VLKGARKMNEEEFNSFKAGLSKHFRKLARKKHVRWTTEVEEELEKLANHWRALIERGFTPTEIVEMAEKYEEERRKFN
jgi:SOS response regulatory protein OraA/RecX